MAASAIKPPDREIATRQETEFGSQALSAVLEHLGQRRNCILDLGRSFGANFDFLSPFASRIVIEDLYQGLEALDQPFSGPDRRCSPVFDGLIPSPGDDRYDLVLLWNLLDYLDRADIARLAARLAACSRPGSLFYALVSIQARIPATPTQFKITGRDRLLYRYTANTDIDGPRHNQVRLTEAMPGFVVRRTYLLRNGMQEYLFEYR